jgi:cation/acetate symporter
MIATAGYDGFLYSIGYLAGWIVALFVVAEPMKRLGKYTFTDALDAKFNSRGIKLAAAISTLVVSVFYLIPQMVGAGVLVEPLLGIPHYAGVIMVGAIVITIVATAGMTSTTYVQFIKGGMLVVFSLIVTVAVLYRGLTTTPDQGGRVPFYQYKTLEAKEVKGALVVADKAYSVKASLPVKKETYVKLENAGVQTWWLRADTDGKIALKETQYTAVLADGAKLVNGLPASKENALRQNGSLEAISGKTGPEAATGPVGPLEFLAILGSPETKVNRWKTVKFSDGGDKVVVYAPNVTPGNKLMRPGLKFKVEGTPVQKLDFLSLMLALFLGTAALPHILIRYYTVPSPAIGFFYVLTMYMGLGAVINSVINPVTDNMSAPLLARSFGTVLFAIISAIAFATVLGTVSGLIIAASGAVAHDLMDRYMQLGHTEKQKVRAGKIAAFVVGIIAIVLGIIFQGMNVSFLVGLAFAVAASANLPAIIMILFWKKTTAKGIASSIVTGMVSAIGIIMFSPSIYEKFGLDPATAPFPLDNPGIVSIPLSFLVLVVVSLLTQKKEAQPA